MTLQNPLLPVPVDEPKVTSPATATGLTSADLARLRRSLDSSVSDNTRTMYNSAWRTFEAWTQVRGARTQGMTVTGEVYYGEDPTVPIAAVAAGEGFREMVEGLIGRLTAKTAPRKVPSAPECWFCAIPRAIAFIRQPDSRGFHEGCFASGEVQGSRLRWNDGPAQS